MPIISIRFSPSSDSASMTLQVFSEQTDLIGSYKKPALHYLASASPNKLQRCHQLHDFLARLLEPNAVRTLASSLGK